MKFQMKKQITINAPAAKVWRIVAHEFDQIGRWSSDIEAFRSVANGTKPEEVPVCGRVCYAHGMGMGEVEEVFTYYDEVRMRYGYKGSKMPSFIKHAENNWKVTALTPDKSVAEFMGEVDINPLLALLMIPYFSIVGPRVLKELEYYAEHDTPHLRKQRALQRRMKTA